MAAFEKLVKDQRKKEGKKPSQLRRHEKGKERKSLGKDKNAQAIKKMVNRDKVKDKAMGKDKKRPAAQPKPNKPANKWVLQKKKLQRIKDAKKGIRKLKRFSRRDRHRNKLGERRPPPTPPPIKR